MTTGTTQFFHISPTSSARSRLEEAEHYFLLGNTDEALAAAQQAWREHPQEPDVFRILAYLHMVRGEYPPAEQAAKLAVQVDGQNPASYATLAQVYLTFNIRQSADQTLAIASQRFTQDAAILALQADLRFRQKRDNEGVALAISALEQNPHDGYAQALLGMHYLHRHQYARAAELLSGAVAAYPQRWDYLRDFGIALVHQQQFLQANAVLIRALQINPADAEIQHYLHYALQLEPHPGSLFWRTSFFFYCHSGLAATLTILGYTVSTISVCWLIMIIIRSVIPSSTLWALLWLLGGLALIYLAQPGFAMRGRCGKKYEQFLQRKIMERQQYFSFR